MKKLVSLFLAVIMVVSIIAIAPISTGAATVDVATTEAPTQAEAVSWLKAQVGKSLDYDGAYGAQCVDLIKYYYNLFGYAGYAKGNGCDYATNALPSGWSRTKGATPQTGDIMVWTGGPSGYGHVAIYGGNNQYYHQNFNGQYVQVLTKSYTGGITYKSGGTAPYWGVIRPVFKNNTSSSITYTSIASGQYYIKSKHNSRYLNVAYGTDADKTTIHTHTFGNWDSQVYDITATNNGYKMRPLCSSSRVVNPYADTVVSGKTVNLYHNTNDSSQWWKFQAASGGYIIRNVQNPNVCLTVDSSSDSLTVQTYTGANNQIWILERRNSISFNANGGTNAPATQYERNGYSVTLPTKTPTRNRYHFLGWSTTKIDKSATSATYSAGSSYKLKGNTTLYAVWKYEYKVGSVKLSDTSYTYNGKTKTPTVTVKNTNGTTLKKGTHYTVSYASGRKNVGKYKVTVKMKGNYCGTKTLYFTIKPPKTNIAKLTAGKKSVKVNWSKKSTQVSGYQIQYSTSKGFSKAKTKTISSYKTTAYTLKNLSAKKTYYVRVRTYKTVNGTKYYSSWSSTKYKKTKQSLLSSYIGNRY